MQCAYTWDLSSYVYVATVSSTPVTVLVNIVNTNYQPGCPICTVTKTATICLFAPFPRYDTSPSCRPPGDNTVEVLKSLGADVVVTPSLMENPDAYARAVAGLPLPRLGLNCTGGSIATSVGKHLRHLLVCCA